MKGQFSVKQLTKYVSYARRKCHPRMTDGAKQRLIEHYVEMRNAGMRNKTITSTPRQLESLIRLAESNSRMRLGEEVTEDDVAEAVRLMTAATLTAATNPETGEIDMDLITTGRSATDRERVEQISQVRLDTRDDCAREHHALVFFLSRHPIRVHCRAFPVLDCRDLTFLLSLMWQTLTQELMPIIDELRAEGFNARDLAIEFRERSRNQDVATEDVRAALDMLVNEGMIREGSNGSYRKMRR